MTFNTGNPIGSTDARDLSDNAENMDYLENSTTELTHPDRLGTVRKTRYGMEAEHDAQISAHEAEHDAQISAHEAEHDAQIAAHETEHDAQIAAHVSEHDAQMQAFESDFDGRLAGMAFTRVGSFTTGATLTDMRQVLIWEAAQGGDGHEYGWAGSFPKVVSAGATPATSGGIGAGAWVDRTDATLRGELTSGAITYRGNSLSMRDFISVKDFGAKGDGVTDDSDSIIAALSYATSIGGAAVRLGHGIFKITKQITVPGLTSMRGEGYSTSADTAATIIKKYGTFTGVVVLDAAQLVDVSVEGAPGNGGDGVALIGGRGLLMNVSSHDHGNDGIKIGAYAGSANNTNLWRAINIISEGNGRHGLYASDDNDNFNCNAGTLIGYDGNRNGGDGLRTAKAGNNQFFGVCCQVNAGYGLYLEGNSGNYFTTPYLEANTVGDVYLDAASSQHWIYGVRSSVNHGRITDLGTNNNILDRNSDFESVWQSTRHFGKGLSIQGGSSSGTWWIEKDADRNLLINLIRTTATGYLHLGSDGKEIGLKFSDGNVLRKVKSSIQTLNFGTVAANSTKDIVSTLTGISTEYTITANANFALPSGVALSAYIDGTNAYYRIANMTAGAIAVSGSCRITAMKIGA